MSIFWKNPGRSSCRIPAKVPGGISEEVPKRIPEGFLEESMTEFLKNCRKWFLKETGTKFLEGVPGKKLWNKSRKKYLEDLQRRFSKESRKEEIPEAITEETFWGNPHGNPWKKAIGAISDEISGRILKELWVEALEKLWSVYLSDPGKSFWKNLEINLGCDSWIWGSQVLRLA